MTRRNSRGGLGGLLVVVIAVVIVISMVQGHGHHNTPAATTTTAPPPINTTTVARDIDRSVARTTHRFWIVSVQCPSLTPEEWVAGNDCVGFDTQNDVPVDVFVTVSDGSAQWVLYEGVQGNESKTPWMGSFNIR